MKDRTFYCPICGKPLTEDFDKFYCKDCDFETPRYLYNHELTTLEIESNLKYYKLLLDLNSDKGKEE